MQKTKYNSISKLLRDEKKLITTDQNAGRGAYGSVFFVHETNFPEMKYAVKVQDIADSSQVSFCQTKLNHCIEEANNMRALKHKHVVTIHSDYIIDTYHFIQMNQCVQSLNDWSRNNNFIISNFQFRVYTDQILSAIEFIHSKNYVLRDLKLDNILLDADFSIKLCDFGSAKKYKDINKINSDTNKGSLFYLPPEIQEQMCNSRSGEIVQTVQGDIWALGICFLLLGKADPLQFGDCYRGGWTVPQAPFLTEQAQQFAQFILIKDPKLRPTISQIRQKFDLDFNFQEFLDIERKSTSQKTDENNQFQKSRSISYPTKEATIYHERKKSTDYVPLTNQQNKTNQQQQVTFLKNTVNQFNMSSSFDNSNKSLDKTSFFGEINQPPSQNISQYIIQPYLSTVNNGNNQFHNPTLQIKPNIVPTNHYISENMKNNFNHHFISQINIAPSTNIPYNTNMVIPYFTMNIQNNQKNNRDTIENYRYSEPQQFNQNKIQTNNTQINENQYYYSSLDQRNDPKIEFFQVIVNLFTWDELIPNDNKEDIPAIYLRIVLLSFIFHLLICIKNIWKNPKDNIFLIIISSTYFLIVALLIGKLDRHQYNRIFFMAALISWIISLLVSNQQDSLFFSFLNNVFSPLMMIFFLNEYYFQLKNILVLFLIEIICVLHLLFIGMTDSQELKYYFIGAIIMSVGILLQLENSQLSRPLLIRYLIQQKLYLSFQCLFLVFIQVIIYLLLQADYADTFDYFSLFLVTFEIYILLTIWSATVDINDIGNNDQRISLVLIRVFLIPNILLPFVIKESPNQIYKVCLVQYIISAFTWIFLPVFKEKILKIFLIVSHALLLICTIFLYVLSLNNEFLKGEIIFGISAVPNILSCLIIILKY